MDRIWFGVEERAKIQAKMTTSISVWVMIMVRVRDKNIG